MPPHSLARADADGSGRILQALGLPCVIPEPEVTRAKVHSVMCKAFAAIIVGLVNENEPLLRAEFDGATVRVSERGGGAVMKFTVEVE